jgi:hypothetical protein
MRDLAGAVAPLRVGGRPGSGLVREVRNGAVVGVSAFVWLVVGVGQPVAVEALDDVGRGPGPPELPPGQLHVSGQIAALVGHDHH